MRIKLLGHYRNSHASIPEGEYDSSDEALQGLASYLISSGHAVAIEAQIAATEVNPLAELRNHYKELAGKAAFNGWDAETLQAKIAELTVASATETEAESDNA